MSSVSANDIASHVPRMYRVALRLIAVPGRNVTLSDKGVAARVDLVEALAAKAALEDAGVNALDAVILQTVKAQDEKK
jgi:hypothetical protein